MFLSKLNSLKNKVEAPINILRILLVEDSVMLHKVMARSLKNRGHSVEIAVNGLMAIDYLKENRSSCDLVLMDLQMPVMDGYEAAREYRQYEIEHGLSRLPIVGISANDVIDVRHLCIEAGMDEFLPKPFTSKQLASCINKTTILKETLIALNTVNACT